MHFSLLVSVFDVDSKEGGAEDDAARGGDAQDRVHRRLHPGLLHLRGDQIWIEKSWLSFLPFWTSGPLEAWTCCWTLAMSLGYIWVWKHVLIFHFFLYLSRPHLSMWRVRVTPEYSPMHRSSSPEFESVINQLQMIVFVSLQAKLFNRRPKHFQSALISTHHSSSSHFKMVFDPIMQCQYPRNCSVSVFSVFDRVWLFDEQFERTTGWSSGWLSRGFHPRPTIWLIKTFREMAMSW